MFDIKKLRELCEKATPGPWTVVGKDSWNVKGFPQVEMNTPDVYYFSVHNDADAQFIAVARTALPEALDEIEWYEQNKTQLEQQVDELIDENDRLRAEIKKAIEKAKNNNPYPVDIFPELTKEEVSKLREVFKEKGIDQARLYASWGRRVWDDCLQEIESFLEVEDD